MQHTIHTPRAPQDKTPEEWKRLLLTEIGIDPEIVGEVSDKLARGEKLHTSDEQVILHILGAVATHLRISFDGGARFEHVPPQVLTAIVGAVYQLGTASERVASNRLPFDTIDGMWNNISIAI
jgi:hypothetical protein